MSQTIVFIFSVLILNVAVNATPLHDKNDKTEKLPTCQEFTQGHTFNESQAIGTWWHQMHYVKTQTTNASDSDCVEFSHVNTKERDDLQELIGKFVENLKWENLTLKMQIPCPSFKSNNTRDYYLEKLDDDGSYRTLQMPAPTAKLDLSGFNRYLMPLKIIDGEYLGMMDCHEKLVFILGRQRPDKNEFYERVKKIIKVYWPEEE